MNRPSHRTVASAAKVSTGTVYNVLHRPDVVAGRTREQVERAMLDLGYQRNGGAVRSRELAWRPPPSVAAAAPGLNHDPEDHGGYPPWNTIPPGQRITVIRHGTIVSSGLCDGSMPDSSGIWILFDDGRGRRFLTGDDNYEIRVQPTDE